MAFSKQEGSEVEVTVHKVLKRLHSYCRNAKNRDHGVIPLMRSRFTTLHCSPTAWLRLFDAGETQRVIVHGFRVLEHLQGKPAAAGQRSQARTGMQFRSQNNSKDVLANGF
jgi:hypothetical protein